MKNKRSAVAAFGATILFWTLAGCHTYEVRQFDSVKGQAVQLGRAAVIMNALSGTSTKDRNKLFSEQLIVSLQKQGVDVAERQKVEALLVDAEMIKRGLADLSETQRAQRLGRLLKVDVIIYADAFVNHTYYQYLNRAVLNSESRRVQLQREANENGVVKSEGYPIIASHAVGLSMRGVDTATGEIVWVGYRFKATATKVKDDKPETITNFDIVRGVCDEIVADLLSIRKT